MTAAEIAQLAGVTRAAVSNWRRRFPDFPAPSGGSVSSPTFTLKEVEEWLRLHGKGLDVSDEVRLWHLLRTSEETDLARVLAQVAGHLVAVTRDASPLEQPILDQLAARMVDQSPCDLFEDLHSRYLASSGRTTGTTPAPLANLVRHAVEVLGGVLADGTVFDPACGTGNLLLQFGRLGVRACVGQDSDDNAAAITSARGELARRSGKGSLVRVQAGDSLTDDQFPEMKVGLVVCEPPVGVRDWGQDQLLIDPRWEFGVPPRGESELAWLQHCYAHTAPGGIVALVLPPIVAARRSGRRIRAELVRRSVMRAVIALPSGFAASHSGAMHVWLLRRPNGETKIESIRMVDLSLSQDVHVGLRDEQCAADVPGIDVLDDDVDLSPSRYVRPPEPDYAAELDGLRTQLETLCRATLCSLPHYGPGNGAVRGAHLVSVADLVRAGWLELVEGVGVRSMSPALDNNFVQAFIAAGSDRRRSTSSTGSWRADVRAVMIPQLSLEDQQAYTAAFTRIAEFRATIQGLAEAGERAALLACDGLATGSLVPDTVFSAPSGGTGGES